MSEESFLARIEGGKDKPVTPTNKEAQTGEDRFLARIKEPDPVVTQANANIRTSSVMTPEQAAKVYRLSEGSGLPKSTISLVPEQVERESLYKATKVNSINEYLADDIYNAAVSVDDIPNLERAESVLTGKVPLGPRMGELRELPGPAPERVTTLSRLLTETPTLGGVAKTAGAAFAAGAVQVPKALGDMFDFFAPYIVDKRKLDFADKNLEKITLSADLQEHLRSNFGETKAEELVGSAFESLGTMGALLATGGGGAILPGMSAIAGIEKTTEALGDRANRTTAVVAGITQAATEYITEKIPIDILRTPAISFMSKLARGAAFDVPGELVATATEMWLIDQQILGGEHKTLDQYKQALVDTALISIITTAAATAPTHGIQKLQGKVDTEIIRRQAESIQKDKVFQDKINAERAAISETKTFQRSVPIAKKFIEKVGVDQDVYISAEGIRLMQSLPPEDRDVILNKIGVAPDKAQAAMATGVDTTIKSKELLTLTEEEYNIIKEDVKPAPGAYTQREITEGSANEDVENLVNLVKEDIEKTNQIGAEINRIQEEGKAAGLTEEVSTNAPLLMQGIANKLELEGVDSVEFLKKISLKKERFADIKALIEKGKRVFQADIKEPKRAAGMLTIEQEAYTISLFEEANLSTVLHEVGHIALNEYTNLETLGQASESLINDMGVIREWVGAEKGQEFTTEQLEQFARGFEAYLLEGKAPTSSLREAFERFKRWMVETYKTVTGLDVKLTPEVRRVFDRMLSTNLEVEAAAAENGFIVKTKEEMNALGMRKEDQVYATRLMEIVDRKAKRRLTQERNKNLKENRKTWADEARTEIKEEFPIFKVADSIKDAALFFKATKSKEKAQLNRQEFIERYGEDAIKEMPVLGLLIKDGIALDDAAITYGYDSSNSMMDAFFTAPKFTVAVNQRVEEKQAAHDAQFRAEDYFVDLKEYRDYLGVMARYIGGRTIDEAAVNEGIQRNTPRWEKEARAEITQESPELSGTELNNAINERVQQRIDSYRTQKAKPSTISADTIKDLARRTMAATTVREARRVDKYMSAMKKASSDERRAILRKDWGAASTASELGRFNYEMASLSAKVREEVDTIQKRAKRIGKPKKTELIDVTHKEAILHLINRYNIASLVPTDALVTPDYAALFAGDNTSGNEDGPRIDDGIPEPEFLKSNVRDFRDLTTEQLRDLDNAIRYLEKVGNLAHKKTLSDGVTLIQDIADESVAILDTMKVLKVWEKGSMMRKLSDPARKFFARLDSLTFTAKSVDGYTNLGKDGAKGPIERWVIDRIKTAQNDMIVSGTEIKAMVDPHLDQISKTVRKWHKKFGNRITIEGVPIPELMRDIGQTTGWKAQQIFAIALNTGNKGDASNYQNLLAGYPDLTPGMIDTITDMLTVEDMHAVQGIWDAMDSLFPKTNEKHNNIKNFNMSKVQATPFIFKGEQFKGGYYPIRHDRELSYLVDDRGKKTDLFESDEAGFTTPYAKSGHTIKRIKGVALPLLLDLSVIDAHFRDTLQYIHFAEVIADSDKITRNASFRRSATKVLGKDVYNTIRPALKHIANPRREGLDLPGARSIEWMRGLSTAYVLAWNTGVAIKQPLSTFGAIRDMGPKAYFQGFASSFMSPSVHYQKMIELSSYMKDRLTSFDRELKSAFLKLSSEQRGVYFGDKKVTWQDVRNFGFWQIRIADTTTVLPIWHGAFNDKLNADQSNLEEAIKYADDIVRNSQPSAQPLDLSSWQRDGGPIRLFSQFQTFTVGKYGQRQRMFYRAWRNGTVSNVDYAWFNFMDAFLPLVAINLLQSLIWGNDLGDDETQVDIVVDVLQSWALMGVPIVGQVARSIFRYGDPFGSPVLETGNKAVRGVVSGAKGLANFDDRREREKALWGIAHTLSILSGVPVSKMVSRAKRGAEQDKGVPGIKYLVPAPPNRR